MTQSIPASFSNSSNNANFEGISNEESKGPRQARAENNSKRLLSNSIQQEKIRIERDRLLKEKFQVRAEIFK